MAYATVDELAKAMNALVTASNTAMLEACLEAAAAEIDHAVDRPADDPIPAGDPLANRINVLRAVEWFKSADAAYGVVGFEQTGALQAPSISFTKHVYNLAPLKRQWGIA